jgi:hypothetical protein
MDRSHLAVVFQSLGFFSDTDCFATPTNLILPTFFSGCPQLGAAGIDFFTQSPLPGASFFLCPQVSLVAYALGKFLTFPQSTAIILFPAGHLCFLVHPLPRWLPAPCGSESSFLYSHLLFGLVCPLSVYLRFQNPNGRLSA